MAFRLPNLSRIPRNPIIIGVLSLMTLLLAQGGDVEMVSLIVIFLVCAVFSYNLLGGAYTASGFLVAVIAMQEIGVPVLGKILFWQPVQSNLLVPYKLLTVDTLGMVGVLAAAYISTKFPLGKFVSRYLARSTVDLKLVAYGAFVTNVVVTVLIEIYYPGLSEDQKTTTTILLTAAQHLSGVLLILGAMLGIYSNIKRTNGKKSLDLLNFLILLYSFVLGVASFSKVGLMTPVFVWLLPALILKFRFKAVHFIVLALTIGFIQTIGMPIAQVGRSDVNRGTLQQTLTTWFANPTYFLQMVEVYNQNKLEEEKRDNSGNYYGERHLPYILERYSLLSPDDLLIAATDQNGRESLPVFHTVKCQLFSFLLPGQCELVASPNQEGRFAGIIPESDVTTGISFSDWADAYHRYGWPGIAVAIPCVFLVLFLVLNAAGSVQDSPWPMIYMYLCSGGQGSTEEGIFALLAVVTYWTPRLLVVYWVATQVIPWAGVMFGMKKNSRAALVTKA
ncbi:hypothetical protein [Edaphobacter sp. DSM 109919]|uniref:Uncharacterized protein n=1 Tax=Edaphobacter paludis TaxID=3035702 RepID=A0AAU7CWL4_9BACT